jgi:hypothetical protein
MEYTVIFVNIQIKLQRMLGHSYIYCIILKPLFKNQTQKLHITSGSAFPN